VVVAIVGILVSALLIEMYSRNAFSGTIRARELTAHKSLDAGAGKPSVSECMNSAAPSLSNATQ
jgi:hypothetical protein